MNLANSLSLEKQRFTDLLTSFKQNKNPLYAGHLLARAAKLFKDRDALIFQNEKITYGLLYKKACLLQAEIEKIIKKSTEPVHIAICFENCPEFYIAYFAAWQTGAVVIPLSTFLSNAEITHILSDAKPCLIITQDDKIDFFKNALEEKDIPILSSSSFLENDNYPLEEKLFYIPEEEPCLLLYTSGTTGMPKGVMLSSKNILTNVAQIVARFGLTSHERVLAILPLFHVFAQNTSIWSSLFLGATIILVQKIERRLLLEGLTHKPTVFLGVPALYGLLCILRKAPLESVSYFASGGDALPDKIRMAFAQIYGRKIINGYGLTETSPVISVDFDDELSYTNTVGKPVCGIQLSIRDKHNKELKKGHIGQLWVKGDNIMLGYHNAPEATAEVIVDGWFNTGDCAYIDTQSKLVITGREKDLIINKGLNIYPQEIENTLLSFPNIIRVAVVGKPDDQEGEIPVAFVQIQKNEKNIELKLKNFCRQYIANYKIPRAFFCDTQELPLTSTGKVDKKKLREKIKSDCFF